jgi:hypothetical protein
MSDTTIEIKSDQKLLLLHTTTFENLENIVRLKQLVPKDASQDVTIQKLLDLKHFPNFCETNKQDSLIKFQLISPHVLLTVDQALEIFKNESTVDSVMELVPVGLQKSFKDGTVTVHDMVHSYAKSHNTENQVNLLLEFDKPEFNKFVFYYISSKLVSPPFDTATQEIKPYHWFFTSGANVVTPFAIPVSCIACVYSSDLTVCDYARKHLTSSKVKHLVRSKPDAHSRSLLLLVLWIVGMFFFIAYR